jgi:hypothetical protein
MYGVLAHSKQSTTTGDIIIMNTLLSYQYDLPLYHSREQIYNTTKDGLIKISRATGHDVGLASVTFNRIWNGLLLPPELTTKRNYKMKRNFNQAWTFVRCDLAPEEREHFVGWLQETQDDIIEVLNAVLLHGYKLSVVFDDDNDTWIATLSGTKYTAHNDKSSMSSRHTSFEDAVMLMLYKHTVVAQGGTWRNGSEGGQWG